MKDTGFNIQGRLGGSFARTGGVKEQGRLTLCGLGGHLRRGRNQLLGRAKTRSMDGLGGGGGGGGVDSTSPVGNICSFKSLLQLPQRRHGERGDCPDRQFSCTDSRK